MKIFNTFKPKNSLISKYVSYYYLDINTENQVLKFDCFPHFNHTISVYQSHHRSERGKMIYRKNGTPFQIFTPTRDEILTVEQIGKVHRIVIVFNPLGIQQFYRKLDFSDYIFNYPFFNEEELNAIFSTNNTSTLTDKLDHFLLKRYQYYTSTLIENSLSILFNIEEEPLLIKDLANHLQVTTRHLNRVFQQHFGVSVKKFQQIILFRKALNQKLFENPEQNFTEIAHDLCYNDQSHLIKTFQNFTSKSPKKFIREGTHLGNEDTFWNISG